MSWVILQINDTLERHRIDDAKGSHGLNIGRAFSNDVILEDPHIDPKQLSLQAHPDRTDSFIAQIRQRTNPVLVNKKVVEGSSIELRSGDELTIGRTHISVFSEQHEMSPTREFSFTNWIHMHQQRPLIAAAMLALMVVMSMFYAYLESTTPINLTDLSLVTIIAVSIVLPWSLGWGIAGYIINGKHHISSHLFFASLCMVLSFFITDVYSYIDYMLSSQLLGSITLWLTSVLIWGLMTGLSLTLVSHNPAAMRKGFIFSTWVISGFAIAALVFQQDYSNQPDHSVTIKQDIFPTTTAVSIDRYLDDYASMFEELEQSD